MRKLLAFLLALSCLPGLTACGEKTLETPPELTVSWTGGEVTALRGGHDWSPERGKKPYMIACGAHPLQCKDLLGAALDVPAGVVSLDFTVKPDRISSARCWSDAGWDNPDAPSEEPILDGFDLYLKEGGWVYTLTACWDDHGNSEYIFYLNFRSPIPSDNTTDSSKNTQQSPPELRIVSADGTVTASKGTYSWMYNNGFHWTGTEADSFHPLDFGNYVETLTTGDATGELNFDVPPDSVTAVECWSDTHWGDDYTTEGESFVLTGNEVTLKPGGYIYEIRAKWDRENYNGTCIYVFHVIHGE